MRKITQQTVNAFFSGNNISLSNTIVNDGAVFLHGNKIINTLENGNIEISFCGWATPTTADRINAIVSAYTGGKIRVGIKQGEPELRHDNGLTQAFDSHEKLVISR